MCLPLKSVHRGGVTVRGLSYSNIVISEAGIFRSSTSTLPRSTVDPDLSLASSTVTVTSSHSTLRSVAPRGLDDASRQRLRTDATSSGNHTLLPISVVALRLVALANPSSGFGKWHFILRGVLRRRIQGASVLSVGTNNSAIELELLRNGADRAVCYELDPQFAAQARFLRDAFEWADNTIYDLEVRNASMERVSEEHGRFDLALALCSLYYLPADRMVAVATHLGLLARSVVLQCNISQGIGRDDNDQYRRASVEFATDLLAEIGFASIRRFCFYPLLSPTPDRRFALGGFLTRWKFSEPPGTSFSWVAL